MSTHPLKYPYPVQAPAVRLSVFSGYGAKGDVSHEQWRSEVTGLSRDPCMTQNTLLQAVRRSLKGSAAEVVVHMSDYAPVQIILQKLDKMFGDVLPV